MSVKGNGFTVVNQIDLAITKILLDKSVCLWRRPSTASSHLSAGQVARSRATAGSTVINQIDKAQPGFILLALSVFTGLVLALIESVTGGIIVG
jgi:hypothetical protein